VNNTEVFTNWIIFTGTTCSGKTTTLKRFHELGYSVVAEPARAYIEEQAASGIPLETITERLLADKRQFQRWVLQLKIKLEKNLNPQSIFILDRGLPDSIAYFRLWHLDSAAITADCSLYRYAKVFIFARLPMVNDGVRFETEEQRALHEKLLTDAYTELGYTPTLVPVMPLEQRVNYVIETLAGKTGANGRHR